MNKVTPLWIFIIMIAVALIMTIFGIKEWRALQEVAKNGIITTGQIVEIIRTQSNDQKKSRTYSYYPQVSFKDKNGQEIVFTSKLGSNVPSYSKGQEVDVIYNPENPYEGRINSFLGLYGVIIILLGGAFIFTIVGIVGLRAKAKESPLLEQS